MPKTIENRFRGTGIPCGMPDTSDDAEGVRALLALCPAHKETPLVSSAELVREIGVAEIWLKDERHRMGLGSFKALGAAYAIAREAEAAREATGADWSQALNGRKFYTASAGNHGLSVAAGAKLFGAESVIFLSEAVPIGFENRLKDLGAGVRRVAGTYEDSMDAAQKAADNEGATLLSDSSWPGYSALPHTVMEGYGQLASEAIAQCPERPSHILLQAGVGGMAAAVAAHARAAWGDAPTIIIVEPEYAPALQASITAGKAVDTQGPVSAMGRLDCKTPSLIALQSLSKQADLFVTISEDEAEAAVKWLSVHGLETTASGAAGVAAALAGLNLPPEANVLAIISEGPADG